MRYNTLYTITFVFKFIIWLSIFSCCCLCSKTSFFCQAK